MSRRASGHRPRSIALAVVIAASGLLAASVWFARSEPILVASDSTSAPTSPQTAPDPDRKGPDRKGPDGKGIVALVDPQWARKTAAGVGIPERAFLAYAGASLKVAEEMPGCGLDWAAMAAVGYVESHHGTIDGGRIYPDGARRPRLIGPALDGGEHARIDDTDDGKLDGDRTFDRAVGPLQFIPQTWRDHGVDANRDGVADPQNIDDAALSAARYLCKTGGDLTKSAGWLAATAAYNRSVDYNNQVAAVTDQYRSAARALE